MTTTSTLKLSAALLTVLALAAPAFAQAPAATPATEAGDGAQAAPAADSNWLKGRPVTIQYYRPNDRRGINVFETTKEAGVEYTGFKLDWGAAFTSQVQSLSHSNTAVPVMASGVNTNQLADIGFGFNNSTANLYLNGQLAKGVRVELAMYLSARHHNETWVKGGYIQMDESPLDIKPLNKLMEFVTLRVGHMEINYGDAHFRRTDNGNALYNPFVGNYMLDAFTTEIGAEVYVKKQGVIAMAAVTGGEVRGTVLSPGQRSPTLIGKLGVDRQVKPNLRLRLTGSLYRNQKAMSNTLYGWRPRRIALLLRAREHRRHGVGAVHLRPDQSRFQELGDGHAAQPVRQVRRTGAVRRDRARGRQGHRGNGQPPVQSAGRRRGLSLRRRCLAGGRTLQSREGPAGRHDQRRAGRPLAVRRRLVRHPGPAGQGGVRQPEVRRLPGDQHPQRRTVQGHDARGRGGLLMTRLLLAGAVVALGLASSPLATAASGPGSAPDVSVREEGGTYEVRATFTIAQSVDVARSVLSDYEQIPRFMPAVKTSVVRQRTPRLLVEQEAVSRFALFSKTVHLLLAITEGDSYLHFVDLCGQSFTRYEGLWRMEPQGALTEMSYELSARPAFDVPGFVVRRLLKRDASEMIERLKAEMAAR